MNLGNDSNTRILAIGDSNKPLNINDVRDPEAYAFFEEQKHLQKEKKLSKLKSNINSIIHNQKLKCSKIGFKSNYNNRKNISENNLDNHSISNNISTKNNYLTSNNKPIKVNRDLTPRNYNYSNLAPSKFRDENYLKSFYEEAKREQSLGNTVKNEDREAQTTRTQIIASINKFNCGDSSNKSNRMFPNFFSQDKEENTEKEFDYRNVETPADTRAADPNEKVISTIQMISQNKKYFKETNKMLKEIGTFYREKKHIISTFNNKNTSEYDQEDKLNNYIDEMNKADDENQELNFKIEKIKSKGTHGSKMSKIHNEVRSHSGFGFNNNISKKLVYSYIHIYLFIIINILNFL